MCFKWNGKFRSNFSMWNYNVPNSEILLEYYHINLLDYMTGLNSKIKTLEMHLNCIFMQPLYLYFLHFDVYIQFDVIVDDTQLILAQKHTKRRSPQHNRTKNTCDGVGMCGACAFSSFHFHSEPICFHIIQRSYTIVSVCK